MLGLLQIVIILSGWDPVVLMKGENSVVRRHEEVGQRLSPAISRLVADRNSTCVVCQRLRQAQRRREVPARELTSIRALPIACYGGTVGS